MRGANKLVGNGKAEHAASELMLGIDRENIPANGFGFLGLVEITVELDFGKGFRNACFGDGFQWMFHKTSLTGAERRQDRPNPTNSFLCCRARCGRALSASRRTDLQHSPSQGLF